MAALHTAPSQDSLRLVLGIAHRLTIGSVIKHLMGWRGGCPSFTSDPSANSGTQSTTAEAVLGSDPCIGSAHDPLDQPLPQPTFIEAEQDVDITMEEASDLASANQCEPSAPPFSRESSVDSYQSYAGNQAHGSYTLLYPSVPLEEIFPEPLGPLSLSPIANFYPLPISPPSHYPSSQDTQRALENRFPHFLDVPIAPSSSYLGPDAATMHPQQQVLSSLPNYEPNLSPLQSPFSSLEYPHQLAYQQLLQPPDLIQQSSPSAIFCTEIPHHCSTLAEPPLLAPLYSNYTQPGPSPMTPSPPSHLRLPRFASSSKRREGRKPQTPNTFFLFRSELSRQYKGKKMLQQQSLSKHAGEKWRTLPLEQKTAYEEQAKRRREAARASI